MTYDEVFWRWLHKGVPREEAAFRADEWELNRKGKKMVEKIKGYRDLSEAEISHINLCKQTAIQVEELCDKVDAIGGVDKRWLAIAKTDLQKGFMALIRSIAKPETF